MLRRLLTFALAGILVLESPATAYAAGQNMNAVVMDGAAEQFEMTGMGETADGFTNEDDAENLRGGGITSDQTDEIEDSLTGGENGSGDEANPADETEEEGSVDGPSDETGNSENGDVIPGETGNTGNESAPSDEIDDDEEDNLSDQPGDGTENPDPSGGSDGENEGDVPSDEAGEGTDEQEPSDTTDTDVGEEEDAPDSSVEEDSEEDESDEEDIPEEDSDFEDVLEVETTESVSSNDVPETFTAAGMEAKSDEVTEISYEVASGNGVQITAPYGYENAAGYSFTAPASGRYVFYTEEKSSGYTTWFQIYDEHRDEIKYNGILNSYQYLNVKTDYMNQGDRLYIETYTENAQDEAYILKVAGETSLIKAEDGSYNASLPGGDVINIGVVAGYKRFKFEAQQTTGSGNYYISPYYCPADHSSADHNRSSMQVGSSKNSILSDVLSSGKTYETVYAVTQDSSYGGKFIALLSGMDTVTTMTADTDNVVYIHDAVLEDQRIKLDIEVADTNDSLQLWYFPEGDPESKLQTGVSGWREHSFSNLKAGTKYIFEFRDTADNELLYTAEYATTGDKVEVSTSELSAVISDDFATMTVETKLQYNGTESYARLKYKFTDSMNKVFDESRYVDLQSWSTGQPVSVEIDLMQDGIFLRPGEEYRVEICLDFSEDHVTSSPEVITVKAPDRASVDPSKITFTVEQDESIKTRVNYAVQIADASSIKAAVFYRPSGTQKYQSIYAYGYDSSANGSINGMSAGAAYDFLLYVGGVTKEQTLKLETVSGAALARVEDSATDYVGPYDVVRTYRMETADGAQQPEGSYYLQLQYMNDSGYYNNLGSSVELNVDNGYQATVSSAERASTWLKPDTDYTLRWMLGKSAYVSESSAECCIYETIHTATAKVILEKEVDLCNYQEYKVTLDAADVVNMKANGRSISLYRYLKAENDTKYTEGNSYYLSSYNNYSAAITLDNLTADTRYELSLRDYNGEIEYAKTTFTTPADQRAVKVTSVNPFIVYASIEYATSGFGEQTKDYILCYYRELKADNSTAWISGGYRSAVNGNYRKFELNDLKENTNYEYTIGIGSSYDTALSKLKHSVTGSFKTRSDESEIKITSERVMMTSARMDYILYNTENAGYDYVYVYVRTNQNGAAGKWELKSRKTIYNTSGTIELNGLQEQTSYEYRIGLGKSSAAVGTLKRTVEGTFTTYADTRRLEMTGTTAKILSADVGYKLSGMENAGHGYLVGYVSKKADPDGAWTRKLSLEIDDQNTSGTAVVKGLAEKTEYELVVGFGDSGSVSRDELKHPQTITFTTLEDQRKVSNPKAVVKGTSATLSALFEGNIEYSSSYVHFYYRKKGTTDYTKAERVVNASRVQTKECSVTISGLIKNTAYEFAAVLSENQYACDEPDEVMKPEYRTEIGEFEIAASGTAVVKPTLVKLSQTKLFLNANVSYSGIRGYGYETLKAAVNPAKASAGFTWESSDEKIVTVSGGRVTAVAPGTATVKVTSSYNAEAFAVCEVVVGNYQIAKKEAAGVQLLADPELNAVKGGKYSDYTVCKIENGNPTEVSFHVLSDNEAVASWNESEGAITVNNTGSTKLVFETEDQVKLYLQVTAGSTPGKGFAVTGFTAADGYEAYAAVRNAEKEYTLAYTSGISYSTEGEIVPKNPVFDKSDFNWAIDKTDIATVDELGNLTPLKAGDVTLSVSPKEAGDAPYTKDICQVTLHIKTLASADLENATPVYALADISSKIGDVKFPDEEAWKGWKWKEPDTPLVINGVNKEYYPFEAVYTGSDHYPEESTVNVYIAKVTGLSVYEDAEAGHNQVVEVGSVDAEQNPTAESDSITLTAESLYYGSLNCNEETNYFYDVDVEAPANIVVKKHEFTTDTGRLLRTFSITATKAGNYTLTPAIKVKDKNNSNEKILAKTTYKIKAVEDDQAYIRLTLEEPVKDGIRLDGDRLIVDYDRKTDVESFKVRAELFDRNLANEEKFDVTKLVWSMSDKKVATVTPSSDTRSAEVKIIGEGHTILTARVKDTAGHMAELKVEIQNHAPRVNRDNVKVNLAYDYGTNKGLNLASWSSGAVEVIPVYGEGIQNVSLYADADAAKPYTGLNAVRGSAQHSWVICPTAETKTGEGSCYLGVKTSFRDTPYVYPLKVTVVDQQATVTARSVRISNLFYRSDPGSLDIAVKGNYYSIDSVKWTDNSSGDNNGYTSEGTTSYSYDYTSRPKNAVRYYFMQEDIQLTADKKPVDAGIVSGKVEVQLGGYKQPNIVSTSLKWNYKKPTVVTDDPSVTLIPAVPGKKSGYFDLKNKTEGRYLNYSSDSYSGSDPKYIYNELVCSNDDVRFASHRSTSYTYTGSKTSGSEKFTVTISGDDWRESLNATHTIKLAAPVPYLSSTKLTMNTNRMGTMVTNVRLKGAHSAALSCTDIVIQGKDARAQKLLDEDLLEIRQDGSDASRIVITENRASTMKQSAIANGTYNYIVIPCYVDADGNRIQSKKLSLKIMVTDKEITAKTKATRSLDLTKAVDDYYINGNYIRLDTTFKNIGNYFEVIDSELVGEYSGYFNLHYNTQYYHQRLTIANESELKAGQKYKLAIRFTLRMSDGDTFTVTGAPFTVKPKQTSAKIRVSNNNQTLYAAADAVSRSYSLYALGGDYRILKVEGSLDCNKDGRPDITVASSSSYNSSSISALVRITDRDGVLTVTGAKGRTYTIPVTVQLKGRDGITKDVKTSIKVTVKR